MIKVLKNPLTSNYVDLKNTVLSHSFPWRYRTSTHPDSSQNEGHVHMKYYGYTFLSRPEDGGYSESTSNILKANIKVLREILSANEFFEYYFFLRSSANCTHAEEGIQLSAPHLDHNFPHYNMLVYLNNSGGETFVEDEVFSPKEDDVILFTGKHYMKRPKEGRRIILVATILPYGKKGLDSLEIPVLGIPHFP